MAGDVRHPPQPDGWVERTDPRMDHLDSERVHVASQIRLGSLKSPQDAVVQSAFSGRILVPVGAAALVIVLAAWRASWWRHRPTRTSRPNRPLPRDAAGGRSDRRNPPCRGPHDDSPQCCRLTGRPVSTRLADDAELREPESGADRRRLPNTDDL